MGPMGTYVAVGPRRQAARRHDDHAAGDEAPTRRAAVVDVLRRPPPISTPRSRARRRRGARVLNGPMEVPGGRGSCSSWIRRAPRSRSSRRRRPDGGRRLPLRYDGDVVARHSRLWLCRLADRARRARGGPQRSGLLALDRAPPAARRARRRGEVLDASTPKSFTSALASVHGATVVYSIPPITSLPPGHAMRAALQAAYGGGPALHLLQLVRPLRRLARRRTWVDEDTPLAADAAMQNVLSDEREIARVRSGCAP